MSVATKVPDRDSGRRTRAEEIDDSAKGAIPHSAFAFAEQHRQVIRSSTGGYKVEDAIPVEIAGNDTPRRARSGESSAGKALPLRCLCPCDPCGKGQD